MKKTAAAAVMLIVLATLTLSGAPPRFEKVSEHFYCYQSMSDGLNVGAVVSEDGILLVNPPAAPELSEALEALKRISARPVRWVVSTDYRIALAGGMERFSGQGAAIIGSNALRGLLSPNREVKSPPEEQVETKTNPAGPRPDGPRLSIAFDRQIKLFPGGLEVRIFGVQPKAHTGGDVAVFFPAEKVLQVGDLYNLGSYPEIDESEGDGSAAGWIDGVKRVIEAVPLLKPAIPTPKTTATKTTTSKVAIPAPEKTLEEEVIVVTGHGPRSNLMELKALLEMSQKLRAEISKLVGAGVARENLLSSPALSAYRVYNGFEAYASQLFDALAKK